MVAPVTAREDEFGLHAAAAARVRALREKYAVSGLYAEGHDDPAWTLGRFEQFVLVSDDGTHVVAYDPVVESPSDSVLRFYAEGRLVKSFALEDLVWHRRVRRSTSGHYLWLNDIRFDEPKGSVVVVSGSRPISFDLSGAARDPKGKPPIVPILGGLVIFGGCCAVGIRWRRRRAARARPQPAPGD